MTCEGAEACLPGVAKEKEKSQRKRYFGRRFGWRKIDRPHSLGKHGKAGSQDGLFLQSGLWLNGKVVGEDGYPAARCTNSGVCLAEVPDFGGRATGARAFCSVAWARCDAAGLPANQGAEQATNKTEKKKLTRHCADLFLDGVCPGTEEMVNLKP